ncbi:diadenylate cyclase [Fodinibius salsisoli]|uniref:Diadenylate cyclase n=1 Tax=Fodinibius salsisoli TaxID=2820877 RepID=A0ABT3PR65_9BACT|nr:diadenylate cyclase [Fodinibius salsisoli]MCW9708354.1 diadenylate cyclase [Fodinibius salsisoli]
MTDLTLILQSLSDTFLTFLRNIRIVDILDIVLISSFLYVVLNWLRQSASRRSLLSFFVILIVYVLARITGMYLTELLIEGLFVIILIGIIVVFQSDMRRIIDRIGSWSFFKRSASDTPDIATSIITEAAAKMAEKRTGALIAIKGREDWDRHMHGGIELDGKITIPLLHSIFNTKAPGHDGAVLSDGQRILKFGVHLPLSTNLYKMSRGGTRHTAALGLSEQCDALVIAISEERGTISIARNGQIKQLESSSDLKKHLDDFWAEYYNPAASSFSHWWKRRSLRTAIASVSLAFILWLSLAYPSETVYRTYAVPIEYRNLESTNIALQDSVPLKARLTLSGSEQAFRTLDPSDLVISFDLASEDVDDNELEIERDDINLPADLQFFEASPPILRLQRQYFVSQELPIKVPLKGQLKEGLELISLTSSPNTVTVLVDTAATQLDSIYTPAVDLSQIQQSTNITRRLRSEEKKYRFPQQQSPEIRVTIRIRKINP